MTKRGMRLHETMLDNAVENVCQAIDQYIEEILKDKKNDGNILILINQIKKMKEQIKEFLTKNFNVVKTTKLGLEQVPDSYVSKIDGSYLTFVGDEENVKFLLRNGITEQLQNSHNDSGSSVNIGFNPIEQKWYGWSHRAIYGFKIGSKCNKGDAHYQPDTKNAFKENCLRFWGDTDMDDTYKVNPIAEEGSQDGKLGVWVRYTYNDKVPNKKMRGQVSGVFSEYPKKWGKGEWTAKTLDDAKQMAIDFAEGVS